jgi:hypothetical protein
MDSTYLGCECIDGYQTDEENDSLCVIDCGQDLNM